MLKCKIIYPYFFIWIRINFYKHFLYVFHPKQKKGRRNAPNGPGPVKGCHAKGRLNYASLCWFIAANRIAT